MHCFLCGKKIGLVRSMIDQQYCSAEHRREARLASVQALQSTLTEEALETRSGTQFECQKFDHDPSLIKASFEFRLLKLTPLIASLTLGVFSILDSVLPPLSIIILQA